MVLANPRLWRLQRRRGVLLYEKKRNQESRDEIMTDDLVTRLRDNCACGITDEFGFVCASCTAADEIERLREEARWFHELSDNYKKCLDIVYNKKAWWKR